MISKGPVHVEIMLTPKGPKMVELGARLGGDSITTHLVPLSTGVDMVKATIDIALGLEPDLSVKFSKGSAIRYLKVPPGIIKSINGIEAAKNIEGVKECTFTKTIGDTVTSIQCSTDRVGSVITQGKDAIDAVRICELAAGKIEIVTN